MCVKYACAYYAPLKHSKISNSLDFTRGDQNCFVIVKLLYDT